MRSVDEGEAFRKARATELERLGNILSQLQVADPSPLYAAASKCRKGAGDADRWSYTVANLIFRRPDPPKGVRPKDTSDVFHRLDVVAVGTCLDEEHFRDPFEELSVEVVAFGRVGDSKRLLCSWHLDRHIGKPDEPPPEYVHPLYHWHFGGKTMVGALDGEELDFGATLLLEAPRLQFPPLDAILAVDFLVSNHYPTLWKNLRKNNEYVNLIRKTQFRIWRAYAHVTANHWGKISTDSDWTPADVWPQLVSV